ncbi:FliH/SctL family protein [Vagococcus sp.]|uniref:FliH/SctL family protein n=1 Tax=Vagococcus sp. TaxID=1933889 RepID=UPI003F9575F6
MDKEDKEVVSIARQKNNERLFFDDVAKMEHRLKEERKQRQAELEEWFTEQREKQKEQLQEDQELLNQEIQIKREQMIAEIEKELIELRNDAFNEGHQAGYDEGFVEGHQAGEHQAQEANQELKKKAILTLKDAEKQAHAYFIEKKEEVLKLSVQMAENILQSELSQSLKGLFGLVEPLLNKMEIQDNYLLLFVNKNNIDKMRKELQYIQTNQPNFKYSIILDDSLEDDACLLETNSEVIDLTIGKQLNRILSDFLSEVEKDA